MGAISRYIVFHFLKFSKLIYIKFQCSKTVADGIKTHISCFSARINVLCGFFGDMMLFNYWGNHHLTLQIIQIGKYMV